jgi:predicted MFS family arabinose efflux permease
MAGLGVELGDASPSGRDSGSQWRLLAVLVLGCLGFSGLYFLFPVLPILAARAGGRAAAGLVTGTFMGMAVLAQVLLPRMLGRFRPHVLLAVSLLLLALPTPLYGLGPGVVPLLLITAARGVGFGILTVVATALVSAYARPGQRGAALGAYGLATSLPLIIAPPLGLLMVGSSWASTTYWVGAALPLLPIALVAVLRRSPPFARSSTDRAHTRPSTGWRDRAVLRPVLLFYPCAVAYGGLYTLLPLMSPDAPTGLLLFGVGLVVARFACGPLSDRVHPDVLAGPFVALVLAGVLSTMVFPDGVGLLIGTLMAGLGVGGISTGSLVSVMSAKSELSPVVRSTLWNVALPGGIASGGLGLAAIAALAGYRVAFVLCSVVLACALFAALLGRPSRS